MNLATITLLLQGTQKIDEPSTADIRAFLDESIGLILGIDDVRSHLNLGPTSDRKAQTQIQFQFVLSMRSWRHTQTELHELLHDIWENWNRVFEGSWAVHMTAVVQLHFSLSQSTSTE
jgi:hypothetical protein